MPGSSLPLALAAILTATTVVRAQESAPAARPAPARGAAPARTARAPKVPDLTVDVSRLFPDRTGVLVEIPHLATLVDLLGGSDQLLQMINERFGDEARSDKPAVLTGRELTAILDSSLAIGTVPASEKVIPSMSFDAGAMVFVMHCSSNEAPAYVRDKLIAPIAEGGGSTRGSTTIRGVSVSVFGAMAVATAGRTVVFGALPSVTAVIEGLAADGRRIGDDAGYVSASAKHASGQDQLTVFVNGRALAAAYQQSLGVPGPDDEATKAKLSPADLAMREAMRTFFGLHAVQGLTAGVRVETNTVKVRYDVEVDRTVNGLISILSDPPTIQFRAARFVPADCGMLQSIAVDPPRLFDLAEQCFGPVPPSANGQTFAQQVEEIEASIGVKLADELLPAIGRELAFTEGFTVFGGGSPSNPKSEGPKPVRVALVEIRDREPFRKMVQKVIGQIPDAPPPSPTDYKGAELWQLAGFAVAFVEDFAIAGQSADVQRCIDAFVSDESLATKPDYQSVQSQWIGGIFVGTYETEAHELEQRENASRSREEFRKQMEEQGDTDFDVERMFAYQAISTLTNPFSTTILRNGTGLNWENATPIGPVSAAYTKLVREWLVDSPRRDRIQANQSQAIGMLNIIADAERNFRQQHGKFAGYEELKAAGLVDTEASGPFAREMAGYRLAVTTSGEGESARFSATATPAAYGRTAKLSLYIDETGFMRGLDKEGAVASGDDPKYPPEPPVVSGVPEIETEELPEPAAAEPEDWEPPPDGDGGVPVEAESPAEPGGSDPGKPDQPMTPEPDGAVPPADAAPVVAAPAEPVPAETEPAPDESARPPDGGTPETPEETRR